MGKLFVLSFLVFVGIASCRKKEDPVTIINPPTNNLGKVSLTFQNVVGAALLDTAKWYTTENGDSLKVNQYKYYVTNFVLHSENGTFKEWESYYLIDENKPSSKFFIIDSIPKGTYNKITFLIGVDEARNTSGAQTGALDPANTMFWDWNTGYIMAKLEGISPQSQSSSQSVSYHILGFEGEQSVLRTVTLDFPTPIEINSDGTKNIHLKSDVLEWFKTPSVINISQTYVIGSLGTNAVRMANNYADMFKIDHID